MSIDQYALAIVLSLNISWGNPAPDGDVICMAHAVYHEAATDTTAGKLAVAWSIQNRVNHRRFSDSVCEVVLQRRQFSYLDSPRRRHLELHNRIDERTFEESTIIALTVLGGYVEDITNGANHYLNKSLVRRIPDWYTEAEKLGQIGDHHYARLDW